MKNKFIKYGICVIALFICFGSLAQLPTNRIKPATMYNAGDTIYSPRLGIRTTVPQGWQGVLPRDTEVFLLMPTENMVGEIFVVVNNGVNLLSQEERWKKGFETSPGLTLAPDGAITKRGNDVIAVTAKMVGANANNNQAKAYLEAKCSPSGFCVVFMLTADASSLDRVKSGLQEFVDNTKFVEPSNRSPYENFDWKKFLSSKVLLNIDYESNSKREDEVNLCADGKFYSHLTRTGIFGDQAKGYQGKKKGQWDVKSEGSKATLTFTFEKRPPVEVVLEARDEEIYVGERRYFVGESQTCK
jgi:hypothetical protein